MAKRGFTIHHNGPNANCLGRPHSRCEAFWASVRSYHTAEPPNGRGWSDIAYSFGICPHGLRLVGRGWDRAQWANGSDVVGVDDGRDAEWYSVLVFIGWDDKTGIEEQPTTEMVAATAALIDEGRRTNRCDTRVTPHNFWKQKRCPGLVFTALAKEWDNAPLTIEEDDMNEDDFKRIEKIAQASARYGASLAGQYLATGQGNSAFNPNIQTWMPQAITLPRLLAAVRAEGGDVDEAELARQLLPALGPDAIAQALIDAGLGDHVVDAIHRRTAPTG
jgi:hypothetical protein